MVTGEIDKQASDFLPNAYRQSLPLIESLAKQYVLATTTRRAARSGEVAGRRTGGSTEFEDRKEFAPGDDLRRIDWRSLARTGRMSVKVYRDDIMPRLDLVVDWTASMAVTSEKLLMTLQMTQLIWSMARAMGTQVRLWEAGTTLTLLETPAQLPQRSPQAVTTPLAALRTSRAASHGGMKVFISDLLFPFSPADLQWLTRQGSWPAVIQVLSGFEASPGSAAREAGAFIRLRDAESVAHSDIRLDDATVAGYLQRLKALQTDVESRMRMAGGGMVSITESTMISECVSALLRAGVII